MLSENEKKQANQVMAIAMFNMVHGEEFEEKLKSAKLTEDQHEKVRWLIATAFQAGITFWHDVTAKIDKGELGDARE